MKVGIVTFWKSEDNYGEALQAFALYKYLENRGHNCFIVKYTENKNSTFISKIFTLLRLMRHPRTFFKLRKNKIQLRTVPMFKNRGFNEFRNKWLCFSKEYSHEELKLTPPIADAFVCGSDQIWGGLDSMMYLSFVPRRCRKIAFAPSFGGLIPNFYTRSKIRKYLKAFDFVSCRENSGVELCKSLGRKDAILFPDPTLMHSSNFYNDIIADPPISAPYVFVYLLGNHMCADVRTISDFALEKGLKILFVTGQNGSFSGMEAYPATIEEWLAGIKNAEYVITNSFHGTVFSLIYHKKFITIPLSGIHSRMNVRINELLGRCGLQDRIYPGNFDIINSNIDFSIFDQLQLDDIAKVDNALKGLI